MSGIFGPSERWRQTYDQWKTASPYDDEEEDELDEELEDDGSDIPLPDDGEE